MATENKLMLLNFAASLLGPEEVYVEVGTWKGLSIVGAMLGNTEKRFYAIDNFSEFGDVRDALQRNLSAYGVHERLTLISADCFAVLKSAEPFGGRKAGVYFYDGSHSCLSQFYALQYAERHLSDQALIVIDDTAWPHVRAATWSYVSHRPRFRLLYDLPSPYNGEPRWWNGVQVYEYSRTRGVAPGRAPSK
jgi:predicted O-methyltransferase YrrM